MFIILLYVDGIGQPFGLRFKDEAKAREIFAGIDCALAGDAVDVTDAYDQRVCVRRSLIKVIHFMPVENDLEAQGDIQVLSARQNAKLQSKVNNDPVMALHNGAGGRGQLIRPQ